MMNKKASITLAIEIPQDDSVQNDQKIKDLIKQLDRVKIEVREIQSALNKRISEIEKL